MCSKFQLIRNNIFHLRPVFVPFSLHITLALHTRNRMKLRSKFCVFFHKMGLFCKTSMCHFLYDVSYKQELSGIFFEQPRDSLRENLGLLV